MTAKGLGIRKTRVPSKTTDQSLGTRYKQNIVLGLQKLRLEDCFKDNAGLGCVVSLRESWSVRILFSAEWGGKAR